MNDIVEALEEEKDRERHRIQQAENLLKCQRSEIESKTSMIKQFELVSKLFTLYRFMHLCPKKNIYLKHLSAPLGCRIYP